jgi:hypothetical protein
VYFQPDDSFKIHIYADYKDNIIKYSNNERD